MHLPIRFVFPCRAQNKQHIQCMDKNRVLLVRTITVYRSEGRSPSILNLIIRWRWIAVFTPRPPYHQGRNSGIHWIRDLFGPRVSLDILEKGILPYRYSNPGSSGPHIWHVMKLEIKEVLFSGTWRREVWYKYNELRENVRPPSSGYTCESWRKNHDKVWVQVQRNGFTSNTVFEGWYQGREREGMRSKSIGSLGRRNRWRENGERRRKIWNCVTHQYYISRQNCSNFSL